MASIVIPAHNEGNRIGGNLTLLTDGMEPGEFEIIVVPNGCTDDTAAVAKNISGVSVIELNEAGKSGALRAGDAAATRFPRIYLDADIPMTPNELRALTTALTRPGIFAATGSRRVSTKGAGLLVKAYYAVNRRLPAYADALYGRGVIAISESGRSRFEEFPEQVADDLFLDSLFSAAEKHHDGSVTTVIAAPRRASQLVRRLARLRTGNRSLRENSAIAVRKARNTSWLTDVVLPRPWLWPAGACYAGITIAADLYARRAGEIAWGKS